jgi:hypothetical protein
VIVVSVGRTSPSARDQLVFEPDPRIEEQRRPGLEDLNIPVTSQWVAPQPVTTARPKKKKGPSRLAKFALGVFFATTVVTGGVGGAALGANAAQSGAIEHVPAIGSVYRALDNDTQIRVDIPRIQIPADQLAQQASNAVDSAIAQGDQALAQLRAAGVPASFKAEAHRVVKEGLESARTDVRSGIDGGRASLVSDGHVDIAQLVLRADRGIDAAIDRDQARLQANLGVSIPPSLIDALKTHTHDAVASAAQASESELDRAAAQGTGSLKQQIDIFFGQVEGSADGQVSNALSAFEQGLRDIIPDQVPDSVRSAVNARVDAAVRAGAPAVENAANGYIANAQSNLNAHIQEVKKPILGGIIGAVVGFFGSLGTIWAGICAWPRKREER